MKTFQETKEAALDKIQKIAEILADKVDHARRERFIEMKDVVIFEGSLRNVEKTFDRLAREAKLFARQDAEISTTHDILVRTPAGVMLVAAVDVQIEDDGTERLGVSVNLASVTRFVEPPSREAMEVEVLEAKLSAAKARLARYS